MFYRNFKEFEAVDLLPEDSDLGRKMRNFFSAVRRYYLSETNVNDALEIIKYGVDFLEGSKQWWIERPGRLNELTLERAIGLIGQLHKLRRLMCDSC